MFPVIVKPIQTWIAGNERLPPPATGEVHVWRRRLDVADGCLRELEVLLSDAERARAGRYRFPRDRRRFIVARATLRSLLGWYLCLAPETISLGAGTNGKPELDRTMHRLSLEFNLSHSDELALYAFALRRPVGIDVEHLDHAVDFLALAEKCFSDRELAVLRRLPVSAQKRAFFSAWTCKEAYLKAAGVGLHFPLCRVEVSLTPGASARLVSIDGSRPLANDWLMTELDLGEGFVSSLVVGGEILNGCAGNRPDPAT